MTALTKNLDRAVQTILRYLCILLFIILGCILLANVLLRLANDLSVFLDLHGLKSAAEMVKTVVPIASLHWLDEIVELCFAALVFYGAAALWGTKGHFCVGDWISKHLPGDKSRALYKMMVSLISALFIAVFFWFSWSLTKKSTELSTVFQIPKSVMYSCMPISSLIMLAYSLADVVRDIGMLFSAGKTEGEGSGGYQSL